MKANETTSAPAPSGVSRRTVVKGAAWAVPVVAVASAVPAMAASCIPVPVVDASKSCKQADQKNYKLTFIVGGEGCGNLTCTMTVSQINANTAKEPVIWNGTPPVTASGAIFICGTDNMSSKLWVTATIDCGGGATTQRYLVDMPSWPSTSNCTAADFAGHCP